jgi:hypothetical protein
VTTELTTEKQVIVKPGVPLAYVGRLVAGFLDEAQTVERLRRGGRRNGMVFGLGRERADGSRELYVYVYQTKTAIVIGDPRQSKAETP